MVKGWVGAAGRGFVGAAPLFEAGPAVGNWSYADLAFLQPLMDQGPRTSNPPTGVNRGSGNWAYPNEVTTEPLLDQGPISAHNAPTGLTHGHSKKPFNINARGLAMRIDKKIKKPWLWP